MTSCIFVAARGEGRLRDRHKRESIIAQIAKELEHGCTAEEILMLNKSNPSCAGAEKKNAKFRAGTEVWLPTAAYCGYVLDAKVAQAEAEAQAKVIDANRKAEAARAEAVRARAETETAKKEVEALKEAAGNNASPAIVANTTAAGSKHQPVANAAGGSLLPIPLQRWPKEAPGTNAEVATTEDAPDTSAIKARLIELDASVNEKQATVDTQRGFIKGARKVFSDSPSVVEPMEAKLKDVEDELMRAVGMKRKLEQAQQDYDTAMVAEREAKEQRLAAQTKLATVWSAALRDV